MDRLVSTAIEMGWAGVQTPPVGVRPPLPGVEIRLAREADLSSVAVIMVRGFPASLRHYCGPTTPRLPLFVELFALLHRAEPLGFRVAEAEGQVVGYVVALSSVSRLVRAALTTPYPLSATAGVLSGRYGVSLRSVAKVVWDKVRMGLSPSSMIALPGGQILTVAVAPEVRGQGIGKSLVRASLDWLSEVGVRRVRLEVRPDNVAALSLYRALGFQVRGEVTDSQGPWLVMVKDL